MACVSTAFAETITDLTDYVYLKTADGVTLAPANPLDTAASSTLNVELAAFDAPVAGKIEANVFTLPNAASFDVSSINVVAPNLSGKYKIDVQTKTTEAGLVVFATAKPKGFVVLFR